MGRAAVNGIELEYELIGPSQGEVVLVITGVIDTLLHWSSGLCWRLADAGYRTLRYDGRDCGRSTWLSDPPPDSPAAALPYTLEDLAWDALGLLEALEIDKAHIVGFSLGGCVAQILAAKYPERVRSLVVLMSTSRAPGLPSAHPQVLAQREARKRSFTSYGEAVDRLVAMLEVSDGSRYRRTEEEKQIWADQLITRGYNPPGVARHTLTMLNSPAHLQLLDRIVVPTTILHASEDKYFAREHGEDLARRIPGARLKVIDGAGHAISVSLVPVLSELLIEHLRLSQPRPK